MLDKTIILSKFASPKNRQHLYKIKDKRKKTIPFKKNRVQEEVKKTCIKLREIGRKIRIIVLKPRQVGLTTYVTIRNFDKCYWNMNQFCAIIAHNHTNVKLIFSEMPRFYFKNLPESVRFKAYNDSANQLHWMETGSQIIVKKDGHGLTPNLLHITEAARIREASETIGETLQGVPENGEIWVESTANGLENWFHRTFINSLEDIEKSFFYPIFLKWWYMPEYSHHLEPGMKLTEYEKELLNNYGNDGLTKENLQFRRNKIIELGGNKKDRETGLSGELLFKQNYPMNVIEAFISKGGGAFNIENLHDMALRVKSPLSKQRIGNYGYFEVYKQDIKKEDKFIISVDPAFGEDTSLGKSFTSVHVFNKTFREIHCHMHGKFPVGLCAQKIVKIARYYNNAEIVIERNMGRSLIDKVQTEEKYDKVYYHKDIKERALPGFPTTKTTKRMIISLLEDAIENFLLFIPDKSSIIECISFGSEKLKSTKGNDDRVMSIAMGWFICCDNQVNTNINLSKPFGS